MSMYSNSSRSNNDRIRNNYLSRRTYINVVLTLDKIRRNNVILSSTKTLRIRLQS